MSAARLWPELLTTKSDVCIAQEAPESLPWFARVCLDEQILSHGENRLWRAATQKALCVDGDRWGPTYDQLRFLLPEQAVKTPPSQRLEPGWRHVENRNPRVQKRASPRAARAEANDRTPPIHVSACPGKQEDLFFHTAACELSNEVYDLRLSAHVCVEQGFEDCCGAARGIMCRFA